MINTIKKTKIEKPLIILFYGVPGIGKTSFASESENPIFIGDEENDEFDVARFPKVTSWNQLKQQLNTLIIENHDYKTLVLDTIDGLETIAQKEILSGKESKKTMETAMGGYGKAYKQMSKMFLEIRDEYLEKIRAKGMQIIFLSHCEKSKFEDPILAISYDTYSTSCHKQIKPIFQDWASCIFFANYNLIRSENSQGKEYAQGIDGERVIYTEERPSHVGKNRYNLPYEIPFPKTGAWNNFKKIINEFYSNPLNEFKKSVMKESELIKDDLTRAQCQKSINQAGNSDELNRILAKIRSM